MTIALLCLFALLKLIDWLLTRRLLIAGVAHEANPVVALLIRCAGIDFGILVPKAVAIVMAVAFLSEKLWVLGGGCLVYVGIVAWNYALVRAKLG